MAVAVLSMGSCQEYDFSFTEQDVFKGAYKCNFTNTFGNIDSDETWDFSEYGDLTRASISYNSVCQDAQGNGETHGVKWYEVQQGTLNWIVDNLPEFKNNTANTTGGNSFSFFMKKGQSIEILPIYLGYATMSWELHMVAVNAADNGQHKDIVFYPPPRPTNIPADYDCMILGVEDLDKSNDSGGSDGGYSDWDFNDIVFLVTGKLPEVVRETKTLTSTIKKRYMIEDLGSTFDQDFNDMVVDVEQTTTVVMKLEDGEIKSQSSTVKQTATVKHLGGTLPIQIKVGDYIFGRVTNPMDLELTQQQLQGQQSNHETNSGVKKNVGIDPEISATITGWNPATNNIVCYVWKIEDVENTDPNTSDIWRVEFPESGVVPFIIAVDPSTPWTAEHELAPINDWRAGNPADYSPVN